MRDTAPPPGAHYTVREAVMVRPLGEELVLLDLDSGMYYSLNGVGSFIWSRIQQGASPDEAAAAMAAEYDVTLETATREVTVFLHELTQAGLLSTR